MDDLCQNKKGWRESGIGGRYQDVLSCRQDNAKALTASRWFKSLYRMWGSETVRNGVLATYS